VLTTLSKKASTTVLLFRYSYHCFTGNCEVIIVELASDLASIISNRFDVSSADIGDIPKSSIIRSFYLANFFIKFVYVPSIHAIVI
jgi:hypothetical protein